MAPPEEVALSGATPLNDSFTPPSGWTPWFDALYQLLDRPGLIPARIIADHGSRYRLEAAIELPLARLPPRLRDRLSPTDWPTTGDWVAVDPDRALADELADIEHVFERRTVFMRAAAGRASRPQPVAANVDTVFVVAGLDGDLNLRRVERYLAALAASGAQTAVILNKADLHPDPQSVADQLMARCPGVPVRIISALGRLGAEAPSLSEILSDWLLPDQTVAVVGSSGVGKSTLVNALIGEAIMDTGGVRAGDDKGRHTTTHRQLLSLPSGGALLDTPGMRELALWADAEAEGLSAVFPDIIELAARCRFNDCGHQSEPGCAVLAAIEAGDLLEERLKHFEKLGRELAFQARRQDESLAQTERQKWKTIRKQYRARTQWQKRERGG